MLPSAEKKLSRRGFLEQAVQKSASATGLLLGGALGGAASTMLTSCSRSMEGGERQVNILNWADYLHPDAISTFEKRYKIQVVQDTFASNEALLAKLQAGGTRYDVIVPSSYMVKQLKKLDIMSPLEHDKIKGMLHELQQFEGDDDQAMDEYFEDMMQSVRALFSTEERDLLPLANRSWHA